MARLFAGEKQCKSADVVRLLQSHENGLRESEIAEMLRWDRRTVNNYLRELKAHRRTCREGRQWYAEE